MTSGLPITGVIINFRTPDLTANAWRTLHAHYPALHVLLIDNGSHDRSLALLEELKSEAPSCTDTVAHARNLHHGPAMDRALRTAPTGYVFFLDSDCVVRKGGFLERMLSAAEEHPARYAVGKKILLNDRGYEVPAGGHEYIRPICMLVKRTPYLSLPPFERHGAPCLANMSAAVQRGFVLVNFPIDEFVDHEGRGTAGRFGYRLGLRGRVNHVLNKFGL